MMIIYDYIMSDSRTTKSIWFQNFLCSPNGVMGTIYRNPLQLLIATIVSCRGSLKNQANLLKSDLTFPKKICLKFHVSHGF